MYELDLRRFSLNDFLAGDIKLYSPPEIFLRISQAINSDTANVSEIAAIIEQDPSLSARVLKIVNSAFYGFPGQVGSVPKAITIVGIQELKMLVMATCVIETFSSFPNSLISMRDFWSHSVRTALFAKGLADEHPKKRQLSAAFMGGLLHDIGRLILYDKAPDLSRAAALQAEAENLELFEAELDVFGFCHADVGAGLIELWKLPEVFQQIAKNHHHPTEAQSFCLETALVTISNRLANQAELSFDQLEDTLPPEDPVWQSTGLLYGVLEPVILGVNERFALTYKQLFG